VDIKTGPADPREVRKSLEQAASLAITTSGESDQGFQGIIDNVNILQALSKETNYTINTILSSGGKTQQHFNQELKIFHPELYPVAVPIDTRQLEAVIIAAYGYDQAQTQSGWQPAAKATIFLGPFDSVPTFSQAHKAYTYYRPPQLLSNSLAYSFVNLNSELRAQLVSPLFTEYVQSLFYFPNDPGSLTKETYANQIGAWVRMAQKGHFSTHTNNLPGETPIAISGSVIGGQTGMIHTFPDENTRKLLSNAFASNSLYRCDSSC
jgi:hypothetical protein